MYFSEVDVDVRQQRPRESVVSLTYVRHLSRTDHSESVGFSRCNVLTMDFSSRRNIRSSDDISSGYSSGEALQSQRVISQADALVRTSSVGARTRAKPRSTTKKTPEVSGKSSVP